MHWKDSGSKITAIQITPIQDGYYRGNAIVDDHPIEEFYDPSTGTISSKAPSQGYGSGNEEKKQLYKDLMFELATDLVQNIPHPARIAVFKFSSEDGKVTELSRNLADKIEMGLIHLNKVVVDRNKLENALKEQQFQQSQAALFDASSSARLGKFVGANVVILGSYHITSRSTLTVTAKVISVETTRVLAVKEKEIPLDGNGSDNRSEILELNH